MIASTSQLGLPDTRQVEFIPGYIENEDSMYLALRAAVQHGIPAVENCTG